MLARNPADIFLQSCQTYRSGFRGCSQLPGQQAYPLVVSLCGICDVIHPMRSFLSGVGLGGKSGVIVTRLYLQRPPEALSRSKNLSPRWSS
ncbi:hypothetical protein CDAR_34461 [Caerostris darwini]|uniref:Uncharacterized protein n=1 Tax=Caerostris darwini TaxID=1538125 RepID=A0AAV4MKH6_9ARAC|nr:hypothetical protein CDAR_34461 [Caerostris darwini]